MLTKKMISLISEQIKKEFESAFLYLEISDFYQSKGLAGFANWYLVQAKEETEHAIKFYNYLHDNNEKAVFYAIEPSHKTFGNLKKPLEDSLIHEVYITNSIYQIYELAEQEKDYRTLKFLSWFISEQQEEEDSANINLEKMNLYGDNPAGLYLLDSEFAKRC